MDFEASDILQLKRGIMLRLVDGRPSRKQIREAF